MSVRSLAAALFFSAAAFAGEPLAPGHITDSISRSANTLLKAADGWFEKQSCVSCHHQTVALLALEAARSHGVAVDEKAFQHLVSKTFQYLHDADARIQGWDLVNPASDDANLLLAAHGAGIAPSLSTAALWRFLAVRQRVDGRWLTFDERPPQSQSQISATANTLRALQLYAPPGQTAEAQRLAAKAARWLERTQTRDTEERSYQLLGLAWAGAPRGTLEPLAKALIATQNQDGGWSQLPSRSCDAYATGEALIALHDSVGLSTTSAVYQRGAEYLLRTQHADGTWEVPTRLHPPAPLSPPYFESGLPYGHSQFISAMGMSWAIRALAELLPLAKNSPPALALDSLLPSEDTPWLRAAVYGSAAELKSLLDSGLDPNSRTPGGTTLLMAAAPDAAKVRLLLSRGADVNVKSKARYTALFVAAAHGAADSLRLLIDKGAEIDSPKGQPAKFGASPIFLAAWSGGSSSVELLLQKGADLSHPMNLLGFIPLTPMLASVSFRDAAVMKLLLDHGAPIDDADPDSGVTALGWSIFPNDIEGARLLLSRGADVNHVDKLGWTPLQWAANVDHGDSRMIELLLSKGADASRKTKEGKTALDIAQAYGYQSHAALLKR